MPPASSMQADWEIEIGADAPVIDADWSGFIDLGLHPERAETLEEGLRFPALPAALAQLNRSESGLRTSKCDVWNPGTIDPDELDAPHDPAQSSIACYIDLLPRDAKHWIEIEEAVRWCKLCCAELRSFPLGSSRIDLIVRRALIGGTKNALGVTSYLVACGPATRDASTRLEQVLAVFADGVTSSAGPRALLSARTASSPE
jgi:hypothetical protein